MLLPVIDNNKRAPADSLKNSPIKAFELFCRTDPICYFAWSFKPTPKNIEVRILFSLFVDSLLICLLIDLLSEATRV